MANKKINQLVLKTTIQSTDLFPLGDATTGQLFKKTIAELQAAIGGAVISVNGLVGTVVLDTDDIQELGGATNRYFTDARARGAISLTVAGNSGASTYNNSTGVLNVPTYTLAGLGGITASFLSGASGIAYNSSTGVITYTGTVFTDASIRALLSAGAGLSYNSSTGVFSYSGTVYTDASIRALISLTTSGTSGVSTYNNTTGVLNVPNYTLAGLGGISSTFLTAGTGISYSSSTGIISYSGTVYTDASVRGLLSGTAPITYNSSTGAIGITQASTSASGFLSNTDWNTFNGKQNALTLGNVTEVASNVLMFPDGGTNKTIGNLSIQVVQSGASTNGYLSSTDWTTFNNKQATVTLTTTGTSGNATFSSGTLNIPNYGSALSGYLPLTGGTLTGALFGTTASFNDGTQGLIIRAYTAGGGWGAIYPFGVTPSATNYVFISKGTDTNLNASTQIALGIADSGKLVVSSTKVYTTVNLGVGTTNPGTLLQVDGALLSGLFNIRSFDSASMAANVGGGISFGGKFETSGTYTDFAFIKGMKENGTSGDYGGYLNFYTRPNGGSFAERLRITPTGNVLINTTTFNNGNFSGAATGLNINGVTPISLLRESGSGNTFYMGMATDAYIGTSAAIGINFLTSDAGRGKITAGGNWLLGTSSDNGERLYVSGSIRATGSITANSDARLKKNIERIENALEKVGQISGYTYNTIYDEDRHAGVIAQEIDKVLPEIVNKGNDGLMGVEYGNISALLIEAIKEQKVLIESLQAKVEALSK